MNVKRFRRSPPVTKFESFETPLIPIVADGGMATRNLGEGRLIPAILVDTSQHPDIEECIRVHQFLDNGDVEVQWGTRVGSSGAINLILTFQRPVAARAILEFDIVKQGTLVDQILTAKSVYLVAGSQGDRFSAKLNAPRIIVEIPTTGFEQYWDDIFQDRIMSDMRRKGLTRQTAKRASVEFIRQWRKFGSFRMKGE
jgi:hypothetical protein